MSGGGDRKVDDDRPGHADSGGDSDRTPAAAASHDAGSAPAADSGGKNRRNPATLASGSPGEGEPDPVRAQRATWARWGKLGKRVGYSLVLVAIVVFAVGAATEYTTLIAGVVTACLLGSTVTLAPGLVIGYAVKKAEREDPVPRRR